jgi:hypothetical protein
VEFTVFLDAMIAGGPDILGRLAKWVKELLEPPPAGAEPAGGEPYGAGRRTTGR